MTTNNKLFSRCLPTPSPPPLRLLPSSLLFMSLDMCSPPPLTYFFNYRVVSCGVRAMLETLLREMDNNDDGTAMDDNGDTVVHDNEQARKRRNFGE